MFFKVYVTERGFALELTGGGWRAEPCEFRFPEFVWKGFSGKSALISELAYVSTLAVPLLLGSAKIDLDAWPPRYLEFYNRCFEESLVNLVEPIPDEDPLEILGRFRNIKRSFKGPSREAKMSSCVGWNPKRAILPFTFGKDSLVSMGVLEALGYEVIPVYVDERVLPRGERVRRKMEERFTRERKVPVYRVENEIQLLSDYQVLGVPETRLYQVQVHFVHVLAMLPFCEYFRAPWIVLSNEYQNSLPTVHRGGYLAPKRVMQSNGITKKMSIISMGISGGQVAVANLIGGLGNLSIYEILHGEFPELGKYQVSCHLEVCDYDRWCHGCDRCAQAFLYLTALGRDPFELGFEESMFSNDKAEHYSLFRGKIHPKDAYRKFTAEEETVGFAAVAGRGDGGELCLRFRKEILPVVEKKIDKLRRKVLRVQKVRPSSIIEKEAQSFFGEVLSARLYELA